MSQARHAAKLLTFNIAHGRGLSLYQGFHSSKGITRNLDRIAKVINDEQPDVVALQEIDESSHWNWHINLLDYLQSATDYPYAIHGVHNRRTGRKPLAYGNAFLARIPPISWQIVPFGQRALGEKGFLEARFDAGGVELDVINLHLDFRSRRSRIQQIEQVLASIRARSEADPYHLPPIICGDFNTGSNGLRDAVRHFIARSARGFDYRYYPERSRTFPTYLPSRGLDFALLSAPFRAIESRAIRCFASDHLPVAVTFDFPPWLSGSRMASEAERAAKETAKAAAELD